MTWEEILRRTDIVGGDIETEDVDGVFRGPITRIKLENGMVQIESPWMAKKEATEKGRSCTWRSVPVVPVFLPADSMPNEDRRGRISFPLPLNGFGTIFPKGNASKLNPAVVEGLEIPELSG